jgi:hypothetical protein
MITSRNVAFLGKFQARGFHFQDVSGWGWEKISLVARMQFGGDLENSLIMLDHVKFFIDWTRCAMYMI